MRLNEAIELQKHRQHQRNKSVGRELHKRKVSKSLIAYTIFPDMDYGNARSRFAHMEKADKWTSDVIEMICKMCGVDANFLFGFPSVHDKEYKKIN